MAGMRNNLSPAQLPEGLRESLEGVAGRYRRMRIASAITQVLTVSLAVGLAAVLLLGNLAQMPLVLRWGIALVLWMVVLGLVVRIFWPALQRMNIHDAADNMDSVTPDSHEQFLTAVEFAEKRHDQFLGSPQLVTHVINRAADEAHDVDPQHTVSGGMLGRWALLCAPFLLAWCILWPLMPQVMTLGAARVVFPWMAAPGLVGTPGLRPGAITIGRLSPAVRLYEMRYSFPAYTRWPAKVRRSQDGAIRALVGAQVRVILHTNEPLAVGSALLVNFQTGPAQTLPLTPAGSQAYQVRMVLQRQTSYRVVLVNAHGVKNRGKSVWPIAVMAAPLPSIHILTPARTLRVRPDDRVPVQFVAGDAFALSAIKAIVWMGHSAPRTMMIPMTGGRTTAMHGRWALNVPQQIRLGGQTAVKDIYYALVAVDNAQPHGHSAMTTRHELILDAHLRHGYQSRLDHQRWMSLRGAIRLALARVQSGRIQAAVLSRWPGNRKLDPLRKVAVAQAAERVMAADRVLVAQARPLLGSDFGAVAAQAVSIARGPMRESAADLARTELAAADTGKMSALARTSLRQLTVTQAALRRLLSELAQAKRRAALKNSLAELAEQQTHIARALSQAGATPVTRGQQRAVAGKLQQLLQSHQSLQRPVAEALAPQVAKLAGQIGNIVALQAAENTDIHPNLLRQKQQADQAKLAAAQEELNRKIGRLNQQYHQPITAAQAPQVTPAMMQAVVRNLKNPDAAAVAREARHNIIGTLKSMARQLTNYVKRDNGPLQQRVARDAAQDAKTADQLAQSVQTAVSKLQSDDSEAARDQVVKAADEIRREAAQMLDGNPSADEKAHLENARADAEQAIAQATRQSGDDGTTKLQQAQRELAQATQEQSQAMAGQKSMVSQAQEAATQADNLAQEQAALMAQTLAANQSPTPAAVQAQQAQTTRDIARALEQGRQMEAAANQGSPAMAAELGKALGSMRQGASQQSQAAAAEAGGQNSQAQVHQAAALGQMQAAESAVGAMARASARMMQGNQGSSSTGESGGESGTAAQQAHGAGGGSPESGGYAAREPGGKADAGQTGQGTPSGQGQEAGAGQAGGSTGGAGEMSAVAGQVQAAIAQQQQAMAGNAQAANQAAQALGSASALLSQQLAENSRSPSAGGGSAQGASTTGGSNSGEPSAGSSGGGGTGISGPMPNTTAVPPEITALGMSPAEWANLGPLRQLRLVNIARQKLPQGYRRLIRNYYLRIAGAPASAASSP